MKDAYLRSRVTFLRFNQREMRGLGIVAIGGQIQRLTDKLFSVKSQSETDVLYQVKWAKSSWHCDCPDYAKRGKPCKHIYAVNFLLDLPSIILSNSGTIKKNCPYCGSEDTTMKGLRYNKTGAVRLRRCKKCNRRYNDSLIAESRDSNITYALIAFDLHCKGVSLRNIENHIWQIYCIDKPATTLHRWTVKLTAIMQEALSKHKLEVGDKWLADETIVKVSGNIRYLWNILDYETRIHIVSILTEGRGADEALEVIKEAIRAAGKKPKKLVTDGLQSYPKALSQLGDEQIVHIGNVGIARSEDNNNRVERLHGTIKSWVKPQRGLKSRSEELIALHHLYYNLVRPHMSLKGDPPVQTGTDGRWLTFINNRKGRHASESN